MKHKNLHSYLDESLGAIANPSHQQIKEAKRDYWKQWYRFYRAERRIKTKEFTLGFTTEYLERIHKRRGTQSVSQFLYASIQQTLEQEQQPIYDTKRLGEVDNTLMELINLLEELLNAEQRELTEAILERIEIVELQFSEFFKTKKL